MSPSGEAKRTSEYPPNPTQWKFERNAIDLRRQFGLLPTDPIDPSSVASAYSARMLVVPRDLMEDCSQEDYHAAVTKGGDEWSAVTFQTESGMWAIMMNPSHSRRRQRSTLMEEIFHVILKHDPEPVFQDPVCGTARTEFSEEKEAEAYYSGSAALVPYVGLRSFLEQHRTLDEIADHFDVTVDLVKMRAKLCRLWNRYKGNE